MKPYVSVIFAVACIVLAIGLFFTKQSATSQREADTVVINDYSNRLDMATMQIVGRDGALLNLSNRLEQTLVDTVSLSNQLSAAASSLARHSDLFTNLTAELTGLKADKVTLEHSVTDLKDQLDGVKQQFSASQASLKETNNALIDTRKQNALISDRLRQDVAERLLAERKFANPAELQSQIKKLQTNPTKEISLQSIYAGLDVEVRSNGTFRVLSAD